MVVLDDKWIVLLIIIIILVHQGLFSQSTMSDPLVMCADRHITIETLQSLQTPETEKPSGEGSSSFPQSTDHSSICVIVVADDNHDFSEGEEEDPLIQNVECRICQEEENIKNFETPCACAGSLKYVHRKCVQRWCNEKGDITCEICHQPYQPGYTAPPPIPEDTTIDISEAWSLNGAHLDLPDSQILAMTTADRHLLEADYDEYAYANDSGAAFCRSVALILMALLLLRHALYLNKGDDEDDALTFFSLFVLRAAGFLLPCYIMAWAISIIQRRRQRQEAAAALASTEVAFMMQAGPHHGLHIVVEPGSGANPHHQEPPSIQS
ncbi:hypothetical protein SAY86_012218 [Trapa natans]|uniref:RING-CH-type domain-containing protein n=1 Tax=Trapa natans TaxID=22666 RepID=A0AAN7R6U7_TRANT|nr:hypothetical protein SAY86_012218 [Trapa natans]